MKRYNHRPADLVNLLSHSPLGAIQQQFDLLSRFNRELAALLQLPELTHCQVVNIKDGRAVILCSSAAWATRLKMQRDNILANFRQKILADLAGIDIAISPDGQTKRLTLREPAAPAYQAQPATLSAGPREQLASLAEQVSGPLQEALQRLLRP